MKTLILILFIVLLTSLFLVKRAGSLKRAWKDAVREYLKNLNLSEPQILTEPDIQHLPLAVQNYIRYTGFIGQEKVKNFRGVFSGGIRFAPDEDYLPLRSVQYNFIDNPARHFYIVARKKGIPAMGLHLYKEEKAIFKIKVLGLFTVVDAKGPEMDKGETVTLFNDMCFMAPGSLIDPRIKWEETDSLKVRAKFTNGKNQISADLHFNEKGELVNFISNDRYETDGKEYKNYPWYTPVSGYREINGYRLPSNARLIYQRPEGAFCYGEFEFVEIQYNVKDWQM